jgi:hypothetical protein
MELHLPIICTLPEAEMTERRRTVLDPIKDAVIESEELPDGYAYSFSASSEVLAQLSRLVEMERQCCRFLTFRIVVEAGNGPIRLEVVGTPEAKSVIADFFGAANILLESNAEADSHFHRRVVSESTITCPAFSHVSHGRQDS